MNKPNYTQPGTSDRQSEIDVRNYRNRQNWIWNSMNPLLMGYPDHLGYPDHRTDADRERYEKMMARRLQLQTDGCGDAGETRDGMYIMAYRYSCDRAGCPGHVAMGTGCP